MHSFFENYDEYHRFVEAGNFSIGLAVVRMDDFYQCKYYNKFVEYSGIGVVGVYTDCDLYRQIIEHGKNGLLCANTTQGWVTAIERLVDDAQLRRNCIQQAQDLLFREFQPKDVCESMIAQLPELAAYNAPQCEIKQVRLPSPELIHIVDVMGYLFRKYFILAVFVIAFKAIRRLFKLNRKV